MNTINAIIPEAVASSSFKPMTSASAWAMRNTAYTEIMSEVKAAGIERTPFKPVLVIKF